LQKIVSDLILYDDCIEKIILYEKKDRLLSASNNYKDSIITIQDRQYLILRHQQLLSENKITLLQNEILNTKKAVKTQKLKSNLIKIALAGIIVFLSFK
jgi:hypothetical protein